MWKVSINFNDFWKSYRQQQVQNNNAMNTGEKSKYIN